jgi:hypothetical protein
MPGFPACTKGVAGRLDFSQGKCAEGRRCRIRCRRFTPVRRRRNGYRAGSRRLGPDLLFGVALTLIVEVEKWVLRRAGMAAS